MKKGYFLKIPPDLKKVICSSCKCTVSLYNIPVHPFIYIIIIKLLLFLIIVVIIIISFDFLSAVEQDFSTILAISCFEQLMRYLKKNNGSRIIVVSSVAKVSIKGIFQVTRCKGI